MCQAKAKSLKAKFKVTRDMNQSSGCGQITCPFYIELECILGAISQWTIITLVMLAEDETSMSGPPSVGSHDCLRLEECVV